MTPKKQTKDQRAANWDSLASALTDLGLGTRDGTYFTDGTVLTETEMTSMFEHNWLARRIVEMPVKDALREGIEFSSDDDESKAAEHLRLRWYDLDIGEQMKTAIRTARLYGGAGLVMIVEERTPTSPDKPLKMSNIKRIIELRPADGYELVPETYYTDPLAAKFGKPETYSYSPVKSGVSAPTAIVHESRVIKFFGDMRLDRSKNSAAVDPSWGVSILQAIYDEIMSNAIFEDVTSELARDFVSRVFQMDDLAALISEGREAEVTTRVQLLKRLTPHRTAVIDKEETLDKKQAPIAGYKDLIDYFADLIAGASGIPRAKLFSQQLGTLAGAEETSDDYDRLIYDLQASVTKQVDLIAAVLMAEKGAPQIPSDQWDWEWSSIAARNEKLEAEARKVQAEVDKTYVDAGVLSPDEVRASRFGSGSYSFATVVLQEPPDDDPTLLDYEEENPPPPPPPPPKKEPKKDADAKQRRK